MNSLRINQTIREIEMALLTGDGPSLESFMGLGPSVVQISLDETAAHSQIKEARDKQEIWLGSDANNNLRAFYICLLEWCFSKGQRTDRQQTTLEKFKRLLYKADPYQHQFEDIPAEFRKLYRYRGFRKILAEAFTKLNQENNVVQLLKRYPVADTVMIATLRSCIADTSGRWKVLDNQKMLTVFNELGLLCSSRPGEVVFPESGWKLVLASNNIAKLVPTGQNINSEIDQSAIPQSPASPLSPIKYKRQVSTISIELDDSEIKDQEMGSLQHQLEEQIGRLDTEPAINIKEAESLYFGEQSFRKNNSSVIEKHSKVEDYFSIKLLDVKNSHLYEGDHEKDQKWIASAANTEQCDCCENNFHEFSTKKCDRNNFEDKIEGQLDERETSTKENHEQERPRWSSTTEELRQYAPTRQLFPPPQIQMWKDLPDPISKEEPPANEYCSAPCRISVGGSNIAQRIIDLKDKYVSSMRHLSIGTPTSSFIHQNPARNTARELDVSPTRQLNIVRPATRKYPVYLHRNGSPSQNQSKDHFAFRFQGSPPKIVATPLLKFNSMRRGDAPRASEGRALIPRAPLTTPLTFRTARA